MGSDKALIKVDGVPMISHVARTLAEAGLEPIRIAVARPEDVEAYGAVLAEDLQIEWVLDGVAHSGPIEALEEALLDPKCGENETLQLAPVDVPWISKELFDSLERGLEEHDALIMPHDGARPHPLLALIRPEMALEIISGGDRRPLHVQFSEARHSLLLEDPQVLRNVNSPEDLGRHRS
jgi:molybdopterin-guanine dinucleotide biosynthesis protein A